jgi:uncharacterized protein YsxB (DUF464 family)
MATILSFLEVGEVQYVHVLSKLKATCILTFYKNSPDSLAKHSPLVAAIVKRNHAKHGQHTFQVHCSAISLLLLSSDSIPACRMLVKFLTSFKIWHFALKYYNCPKTFVTSQLQSLTA